MVKTLSCGLRGPGLIAGQGKATKRTTARNAVASNEPITFRETVIMAISEIGHV